MTGYMEAHEALDKLIRGEGGGSALLVAGAPQSGKTGFAHDALLRGLDAFGDAHAMMTVANRVIADTLGDAVIRHVGASAQVRPVTTLAALAFRVIADDRFASGGPAPRLLNGAEQDALLRGVLAAHLRHAESGDVCGVCMLLRDYFASDDWRSSVGSFPDRGADASSGGRTTAAFLERGVSAEFVGQLRDMLARMNELGVSPDRESELLLALEASSGAERNIRAERLRVQWRLAFALRREYGMAVEEAYPNEYRLDSSELLTQASTVLRRGGGDPPELLVVDDFQDSTLAAMRFLEAASGRGTRLVLVGDPDEAVQTFRGSYPEYLFARAVGGPIAARSVALRPGGTGGTVSVGGPTYRDVVASRISLSIPSPLEDPMPLPERPWKLPRHEGAWPIVRLDGSSPLPADGSLRCALYRSPREELDDVVWRIKHEHLDGGSPWNDMAVIAHDNGTVRLFGERLRRDGVPVRYSSVTRPLKEEPFVRGLFALIELARLRNDGIEGAGSDPRALADYVRARVATLMTSRLVTVSSVPGEGAPGRMEPIEAAMHSLESLAPIVDGTTVGGEAATETPVVSSAERDDSAVEPAYGALGGLMAAWSALVESWPGNDDVHVDDSLLEERDAAASQSQTTVSEETRRAPVFGVGAQYVMLALDDSRAPASHVLAVINQVLGGDPQARAFIRLWTLVGKVASAVSRLESDEPQFVLAAAWDATGVATAWQCQALANTPDGRAANDRLDVAMRLFQYAEDGSAGRDIAAFIAQVRSMQIEADSLARVKPMDQAVTLTTPAGAAGRHWNHVWIPAMQQDVWPNLAERNTMFGGEDMADIVLRGPEAHAVWAMAPAPGTRLGEVLSGEKKSLLYAITRAAANSHDSGTVTVSAVDNDDLTPSDFLYGYMPECFGRGDKASFAEVGGSDATEPAESDESTGTEPMPLAGLDCDPRGLVAVARIILSRYPSEDPRARDAAAALALLAGSGVTSADPDAWAYLHTAERDDAEVETGAPETDSPVVSLSPSAVDRLWECPVCWLLENRFAGPRPGSAATGFGTLIHAVAQRACEEGLDLPGYMADAGVQHRLDAVTRRLIGIYDEIKTDASDIDDPAVRYAAIRKDEKAGITLANLASYFVYSNEPDYLGSNTGKFDVGRLERSSCEEELSARFGLDEILAAYNAVPGAGPAGRGDLMTMMGTLVGGWPEGMREDLTIRLSGRIDRKEIRIMADGSHAIRLIDYKTGHVPSTLQRFNDLQLVCYQLGLAFPEHAEETMPHGGSGHRETPVIAQSALFHVEAHEAPAQSFAPEGLFQPALFTGGALNSEPFAPRFHYRDPAKLMDVPVVPMEPPQGIDPHVWERFVALQGTQAMWALAMIARVFYAASASRSTHLTAHPTAQHLAYCRMRTVCPACAGQVDTVFETRQA